jgi:hypothetical protein
MATFVPTADDWRGGHQLRTLQPMNAKEYRSTLSRRRSRSNFRWRRGFDLDRHRFGHLKRFLRFDFLADRRNRVTHFLDNALQIVSRYTKPPSQDSNLAGSVWSILLRMGCGLAWRIVGVSLDAG